MYYVDGEGKVQYIGQKGLRSDAMRQSGGYHNNHMIEIKKAEKKVYNENVKLYDA